MMQCKNPILKLIISFHHGNPHANLFQVIMREVSIVHSGLSMITKKIKDLFELPI